MTATRRRRSVTSERDACSSGTCKGAAKICDSLPAAANAGKICVEFKMFKDTEANVEYDQLKLQLIEGATVTDVWVSGLDAYNGYTGGAFHPFAVDISSAAGKAVKLAFDFDSGDALSNRHEGVYLDDIRVLKNCTP